MEIHISDWTHKFQNKTGLDAKAKSELYKSKQVKSVCYWSNELASICDFHHVSVLCTFNNLPAAAVTVAGITRSSQLSIPRLGQAV